MFHVQFCDLKKVTSCFNRHFFYFAIKNSKTTKERCRMKNISLVLLALVLALTFTASDIVVEKGKKLESAKKCPYLENLQQNHSQLQCPYLNGRDGNSACPYAEENSESASGDCPYLEGKAGDCPYLNGKTSECPYLKEPGEKVIKAIETHPLPEGKNS